MGWFLINVVLPLVAPLLVLVVLKPLPLPDEHRRKLNLLIAVKDGQLCWSAIGLAASALYEIGGKRQVNDAMAGYLQAAAVAVIAAASVIAAGGAMYPTALIQPKNTSWLRHYSTFVVSIFLAAWAASVCLLVHFGLR